MAALGSGRAGSEPSQQQLSGAAANSFQATPEAASLKRLLMEVYDINWSYGKEQS